MAEILDYFDQINIDIAKKKYYNVNKVNAVLEDLRTQAEALVQENERQQRELESLRMALEERSSDDSQAHELLTEMQALYRDTLDRAHLRADDIVRGAEAQSEKLMRDTEQKSGILADRVKDCFDTLQAREKETLQILNDRLKEMLDLIDAENASAPKALEKKPDSVQNAGTAEGAPFVWQRPIEESSSQAVDEEEEELPTADEDQLKTLEQQIRRLAEEINAMESDN